MMVLVAWWPKRFSGSGGGGDHGQPNPLKAMQSECHSTVWRRISVEESCFRLESLHLIPLLRHTTGGKEGLLSFSPANVIAAAATADVDYPHQVLSRADPSAARRRRRTTRPCSRWHGRQFLRALGSVTAHKLAVPVFSKLTCMLGTFCINGAHKLLAPTAVGVRGADVQHWRPLFGRIHDALQVSEFLAVSLPLSLLSESIQSRTFSRRSVSVAGPFSTAFAMSSFSFPYHPLWRIEERKEKKQLL
jgi:hypothetical protein